MPIATSPRRGDAPRRGRADASGSRAGTGRRRSRRAGGRARARAAPTRARPTPQSCSTSRTSSSPASVAEAVEPVGVALDRVVQVPALGARAEAHEVGRDRRRRARGTASTGRRRRARRAATAPAGRRPARCATPRAARPARPRAVRSCPLSCRGVPTIPRRDWTPPSRRRVLALRDRLRLVYGRPSAPPHRRPLDELILTVLSQSTNDRNRDVAFLRLRTRFPSWTAVREAPLEEVEEAIRPGGISKVKSARIQAILRALPDPPSLDHLAEHGRRRRARRARARCPASGRKTAACVLLFSYGMPDIPVDTHVSRVGTRLGLFRPGAPFEELHDDMLALTPRGQELEFHVNLLRHGRRTCHAQRPSCPECALAGCARMGRRRTSERTIEPSGGGVRRNPNHLSRDHGSRPRSGPRAAARRSCASTRPTAPSTAASTRASAPTTRGSTSSAATTPGGRRTPRRWRRG